MATWADVRAVFAGLPGSREDDGAWRAGGKVVARRSAGDDGALVVWRDDEEGWATVELAAVERSQLAALLTEAWQLRAPGRVVRAWKGTR